MSWRPTANLEILRLRARWLKQIRAFFEARQVLEAETPVLSASSVPDPNIESLLTEVNRQSRYLQTSPELYMKRLLAAGSGPIYQIARVFRDSEVGQYHNPEFTLVEWYQPGYSQQQLMDEVTDLVKHLFLMGSDSNNQGDRVEYDHLSHLFESDPIKNISYQALFEQAVGINPLLIDWPVFDEVCQTRQLQCPVNHDDWSAAMDWLLSIVIQPTMRGLIFVTDYPASQASLARLDPDNPEIARRFELFIDGIEMANGFEELTNATEQQQRFEQENEIRKQKGLQPIPLDKPFLDALAWGLPETAGVALGLDRLLMWKTGSNQISEVMSFAFSND